MDGKFRQTHGPSPCKPRQNPRTSELNVRTRRLTSPPLPSSPLSILHHARSVCCLFRPPPLLANRPFHPVAADLSSLSLARLSPSRLPAPSTPQSAVSRFPLSLLPPKIPPTSRPSFPKLAADAINTPPRSPTGTTFSMRLPMSSRSLVSSLLGQGSIF